MGHFAERFLLFACFVALAVSDLEIKPPSDADLDILVKGQIKGKVKRDAPCGASCPFGWVKFDNRCFNYFSSPLDFYTAESYCGNLGANLVSIHNDNEYNLVKALIRAYDPSENPTWIGLSDCQKRFGWLWSDGTRFDFAMWNPNEPNNVNGECCVHVNWASEKRWNDIPCELKYPFVCVKRVK